MSEGVQQYSPLSQIDSGQPPTAQFRGVELQELAFLGHFNIRLQPDDNEKTASFKRLFEFDLPMQPNTFLVHGLILCVWLAPDEWLLVCAEDAIRNTRENVREIASSGFTASVNQSSAQTMIRVSGPRSADFLSRSIAYDLHARTFKPNQSVQTVLARTPVIILNQTDEEMKFDIVVRRSFSDYLWRWLVDTGEELDFRQ